MILNILQQDIARLAKHFKFATPVDIKKQAISSGVTPKAVYGGIDFYEYHEYKIGDDIRFIDWNLLARFDKKIIRTFCSEYTGAVGIVIDTSVSMTLGFPQKREVGEKILLLLANIAKNSNFSSYIYLFSGETVKTYPNFNIFYKEYIERGLRYEGTTYLDNFVKLYPQRRNSIHYDFMFFISDFHSHDKMEIFFKVVKKCAKKVVLLQVFSLAEIEAIKSGRVLVEDPETNTKKELTVSGAVKKNILANYMAFLTYLKTQAMANNLTIFQQDSSLNIYNLIAFLLKNKVIKKEK
jgi:uncharacterized protein (DUF58 family)